MKGALFTQPFNINYLSTSWVIFNFQLVSDLERHLGEFHSNGDLLEDAVDKAKAADASGASAVSSSSTSDMDLVS